MRYTLTEDNAFRMDYRVSSDADTIVNLTNHSYFNLDGGGDVLNQKLRIYASRYLEGNNQCCPTGAILPVADTPMDFTAGKLIGREIDTGFAQTTMVGGGYDHCYVIDRARGSSQSICAWATSDKTGISMKLYTTQPGIQLYTANFLQDCPSPGKGGKPLQKYGGFALETQHYPCSPSHPELSLHGAAGRQGVPRHYHPALLHRQTVRETVTTQNGRLPETDSVRFLSPICTKRAIHPFAADKKCFEIRNCKIKDATKLHVNKNRVP